MVPRVAVVVVNWNRPEVTAECLASVQRLAYPEVLPILVDNGSTDDSVERLSSRFPEWTLLRNSCNLGFAEGNNVAIRHALSKGVDYVLLLNNDAEIHEQALHLLVEAAESDPSMGILGATIYLWDPPDSVWFAGGLIDWRNGDAAHRTPRSDASALPYDTEFVTGCGMLVRSQVFARAGLFDPRYYLYYEDADLSFRARAAGWRTVVVPGATMWHKVAPSLDGSARSCYYAVRNRYLFATQRLRGWRRMRFVVGYLTSCMRQYRYLEGRGKSEEAAALLDGLWDALRGRYGAGRRAGPTWLGPVLASKAVDGVVWVARGGRIQRGER